MICPMWEWLWFFIISRALTLFSSVRALEMSELVQGWEILVFIVFDFQIIDLYRWYVWSNTAYVPKCSCCVASFIVLSNDYTILLDVWKLRDSTFYINVAWCATSQLWNTSSASSLSPLTRIFWYRFSQ